MVSHEIGTVLLAPMLTDIIIVATALLGAIFAAYQTIVVSRVKVNPDDFGKEDSALLAANKAIYKTIHELMTFVSDGATAFLFEMYKYMAIFMVFMSAVILLLIGPTVEGWDAAIFSTVSFLWGAITSIASGWIGMRIAVYTNGRCSVEAMNNKFRGGFITAFRGGIVMGFALTSLGLLNLWIIIQVYKVYFGNQTIRLFGCIAAYGLGGSSIAMFGRVGGGIFTKAADVGADLVGKVDKGIPEDDDRNPGVLADCVGDNVGDIAGMGADLFGSFAEASCAALVIASYNPDLAQHWSAMMYPLVITGTGIVTCLITTFAATSVGDSFSKADIEPTLKQQLLVSTVLSTVTLFIVSVLCLPSTFQMYFMNGQSYVVHNWYCFIAVAGGLWAGLAIGYITEYFTSNQYTPVREVADACTSGGAATNVIYGLALGYKSTIIPSIALAMVIWIGYNMTGVYGIALGALGILSTMSIALTIDAYGPISDNAGGLAEMSHMDHSVRFITDALDAAGNTTAAIGKGYAIGSAALVSLALYGAFLTRAFTANHFGQPVRVNIIDPRTFFGLLIGAMLPYWFSALTMKSVGIAATAMVKEILRQFKHIPGIMERTAKPQYDNCVKIATDASLREMIAPGCLVVFSPIIFGIFFGKEALAGLLPGALVSGVQMAISASNTGGAWDNAKKYIECDGLGAEHGKGSKAHEAAVVGDTIGDPMKDTYGPALNILIKLMAIISVVFAPVVADPKIGGLIFDRLLSGWGLKDAAKGTN
eukprot:NODE_413_length_2526_cov_198.332917_g392_i0.p1 GENE.NODE_413_length_2526_cov_198.332917_g392_i0~~NODE_413_length_2526_cov_198.332917_g392_i0.p1  ORF type:complete len:763 (-),score=243.45 NODE_413_length_2526_cov_198.332917_g392_i0:192-2480(-)